MKFSGEFNGYIWGQKNLILEVENAKLLQDEATLKAFYGKQNSSLIILNSQKTVQKHSRIRKKPKSESFAF